MRMLWLSVSKAAFRSRMSTDGEPVPTAARRSLTKAVPVLYRVKARPKLLIKVMFELILKFCCNFFSPQESKREKEDWKWACSWRELLDPGWVSSVVV